MFNNVLNTSLRLVQNVISKFMNSLNDHQTFKNLAWKFSKHVPSRYNCMFLYFHILKYISIHKNSNKSNMVTSNFYLLSLSSIPKVSQALSEFPRIRESKRHYLKVSDL